MSAPSSSGLSARPLLAKGLGLSIFLSILMIVCGVISFLLAAETSIAVVIILAWIMMIGGVVQFVHAFGSKGVGMTIWKILVALAYFVTGLFLRVEVGIGVAALTLAMIGFFLAQGVISLVAYVRGRKDGSSSIWLLIDGLVTLILGLMVWRHWPASGLWLLGAFVGINLVMNGASRLMISLTLRRALKEASA